MFGSRTMVKSWRGPRRAGGASTFTGNTSHISPNLTHFDYSSAHYVLPSIALTLLIPTCRIHFRPEAYESPFCKPPKYAQELAHSSAVLDWYRRSQSPGGRRVTWCFLLDGAGGRPSNGILEMITQAHDTPVTTKRLDEHQYFATKDGTWSTGVSSKS